MARLQDRIAVITGSGAGMGEGIARVFAGEGAKVVISARNETNGDAVAASIVKEGGHAVFQRADVRVEADCRALIDRAVEVYGRIDVLVNNAGIVTRGNIETMTAEVWDDIFATNVRGAFICTQQAVTYMKEQRIGSIVNIGSINA
jgi:NAD(P)-dependent dehydrogenase (short-subunit alcohol dehydrogenase family)